MDSRRALVTRRKSTCCRPVRPLLEARRACAALHCMKTVYKYRRYGNRLSLEDGKACRWTGIVSICLSGILPYRSSPFARPHLILDGHPCKCRSLYSHLRIKRKNRKKAGKDAEVCPCQMAAMLTPEGIPCRCRRYGESRFIP